MAIGGPWTYARICLAIAGTFVVGACNSPTTPAPINNPLSVTMGSCTYTLDLTGMPTRLPSTGGTFTIRMLTDAVCRWSLQDPPFPLIAFVSFSSSAGYGQASISVTVRAHTGLEDRAIEFAIQTIPVRCMQAAASPVVAGADAVVSYSGTAGDTVVWAQAGVVRVGDFRGIATGVNQLTNTRAAVFLYLPAITNGWNSSWEFILQAPNGQVLTVGAYEDAQRWDSNRNPKPTMQFAATSIVCGPFTGRFDVYDVAFDSKPDLTRLHARVVEHCNSNPSGAVATAEIWYPSKGAIEGPGVSTLLPAVQPLLHRNVVHRTR